MITFLTVLILWSQLKVVVAGYSGEEISQISFRRMCLWYSVKSFRWDFAKDFTWENEIVTFHESYSVDR